MGRGPGESAARNTAPVSTHLHEASGGRGMSVFHEDRMRGRVSAQSKEGRLHFQSSANHGMRCLLQ